MPDVFLKAGEANPSDVRLADPTSVPVDVTNDMTGIFAAAAASAPVAAVMIDVAPAATSSSASAPVPAAAVTTAPSASAAPASMPAPNFGEVFAPGASSATATANVPAAAVAAQPTTAPATAAATAPAAAVTIAAPAAAASAIAPPPAVTIIGNLTVDSPAALATASMPAPTASGGIIADADVSHHFGAGRQLPFLVPQRLNRSRNPILVIQNVTIRPPAAEAEAWMPLLIPTIVHEYVSAEVGEESAEELVASVNAAVSTAAASSLASGAAPEVESVESVPPVRIPVRDVALTPASVAAYALGARPTLAVSVPEIELDEVLATIGIKATPVYRATEDDDDIAALHMLLTV